MIKFKTGQIYYGRMRCSHLDHTAKIIRRSEKSVWVKIEAEAPVGLFGIKTWGDREVFEVGSWTFCADYQKSAGCHPQEI